MNETQTHTMNNSLTPAAASFVADVQRMTAANLAKYASWGWTYESSEAVREMTRLQKAANEAAK